jgi:DNA-binding CsgD family transcriptional regulator
VTRRTSYQTLSERDEGVLLRLADGLQQTEVAAEMGIGVALVNQAVSRLRIRLGARNATHLVALAYHKGLLTPRVRA